MTRIQNQDGTISRMKRSPVRTDEQASTSADGVTNTKAGQAVTPAAERANRSIQAPQSR